MAVDNFTIKSLSSLLSSLLALAFPLALMAQESRTVVVMMMKTKVVDGADEWRKMKKWNSRIMNLQLIDLEAHTLIKTGNKQESEQPQKRG